MSKTNKIFSSIPVEIPDRSGFDLSHEVLTTAKVGTVIPITHFEVLPGDTISMGSMMKVTLPPFAVPFMGRIDAELTAAFIPNRLLWNGWQSFITANNGINVAGATPSMQVDAFGNLVVDPEGTNVPVRVPVVAPADNTIPGQGASANYPILGPNSLADYLGFRIGGNVVSTTQRISALPFLAYQKFCDDWIRDENNMKPFFPKMFAGLYNDAVASGQYADTWRNQGRFLPYSANGGRYDLSASYDDVFSLGIDAYIQDSASLPFDQSIGLGSLRQRCWAKDYFTTATTRPQAGADSSVRFGVRANTDTLVDGQPIGNGSFTIATLRAANSLQKWLERNNIAGTEYGSQILAHFGVTPPDAVLNRSVLLGSVRTPVVVSSVENNSNAEASSSRNPYGSVLGSAAGFGSGAEKGSLVDDFTAKEHGFIMVFFTLIPHAYYNSGVERSLTHKYLGDFAWPEFAGIGDQPIYDWELVPGATGNTFGYQQRYVEYKHKLDTISGLLVDGRNMDAYALQRGFDVSDPPELGKQFLEIPTDYLDQVYGVSADVAGFGCMVDAYFDCSALRILPEYSLPHL